MDNFNKPNAKVILSTDDYDKLVEMANANEEAIKSKAMDYWRKHGVASVNISVYLRKLNIGQDFIEKDYTLDVLPLNVQVYDDPDRENSGMAITQEQKDKIRKFACRTANSIFTHSFGDRLSRINEIVRLKADIRREWRMTRTLTLIGWLTAITLFLVILLTK